MKNLTTHFTNITKGSNPGRPILQGISYNAADNSMSATDSHRLLQVKVGHVPATYIQDPTTLEFLEGTYPNVTRLVPQINENITITPNTIEKTLLPMLKVLKEETILLSIKDKQVSILQENNSKIGDFYLDGYPEDQIIACNAKYLLQALAFVIDCDKFGLTREPVIFNYSTPVRPFLFATSCYTYLITPIRRS
jgi:hypothetical protein